MSLLRKSITETDQSLMKLDVAVDHRYIYIWIVGICTATAFNGLSFCLFYVYMGSLQGRNVMIIFCDLFCNIMMYIGGIVVLDFMTHVCWLERSFKRTNDLLKKFLGEDCTTETEDSNNKMIVSWFSSNEVTPFGGIPIMKRQLCTLDKVNILQQIRLIHLQLCAITKLLNKIFDTQMMFYSIVIIQSVVGIFYYVYTEIDLKSPYELSFYVLDAIYTWLKVAVTCYFCEKSAKEAKQIVYIIHSCSIHNSDVELRNELTQFCLQVSLAEMDTNDTHLFWLNDVYILQSIGGIFTYFLIMIQWSGTLGVFGSKSNFTTFN
ncbi:uncharacterized protein LOC117223918 [Megalopta genalis]|uniref:uncharacterized protein LOC117223918 n=1 Tax=Megalopta genalis TaxID=115081 RepID=UPI003FD2B075